jgi:phage terminase small subunit
MTTKKSAPAKPQGKQERSKAVKQRRTRFIKEFLIDQNATRAAKAAGFSPKTAHSQGQRLLKNAEVRSEIDSENEKANSKLDLTVDRVKLEIARLAFYDPAAFWNENGSAKPIHEIDEDSRRALSGFEMAELFEGAGEDRAMVGYVKKFKLASKDRALELAARHLKMLTDKVEITGDEAILQALAEGRKRAAQR